jgi:DNA-directed RNA polymerase subunit RPC12/RpoP
MNTTITHYECGECQSVFQIQSDCENKLSPTVCPFCGDTDLGEGYLVDCDE